MNGNTTTPPGTMRYERCKHCQSLRRHYSCPQCGIGWSAAMGAAEPRASTVYTDCPKCGQQIRFEEVDGE